MLRIDPEGEAFVLIHTAEDGTVTRLPVTEHAVESLVLSADSLRAFLAAKRAQAAPTGLRPVGAIPVVDFSVGRDAMLQFVLMELESPTQSKQTFALRPDVGGQLAAAIDGAVKGLLALPEQRKN